jgi:hypothetical protein
MRHLDRIIDGNHTEWLVMKLRIMTKVKGIFRPITGYYRPDAGWGIVLNFLSPRRWIGVGG